MNRTIKMILFIFIPSFSIAQTMPIEAMMGNRNYWYQHSLGLDLKKDSRFGFFHTHSTHFFYDKTKQELMSQSYLNYKVNSWMKINLGVFYVTKPGINASASIHLYKKFKNVFLLSVPRIDLYKNPSYDVMSMIEYKPKIGKVNLYTRLQTLFSFKNAVHTRSYQNIRVGINNKNTQYGIAVNYDAYGPSVKYYSNYGLFIKHDLKIGEK